MPAASVGPLDSTALTLGLSVGPRSREGEKIGVPDVWKGVADAITGTVVDCKGYAVGLLVCAVLGDLLVFGARFGFAPGA